MEKALSGLVKEGIKPADGPVKLFEKVKDKVLTFACGVYPNRPAVCRMYPVGRCKKKVEKRESGFDTIWFMQDDMPDWCGDRTAEWTLKEWLDKEEWWHYQEGSDLWFSVLDKLMEAGISTKPAKFAMNKKSFNQDTMSLFVNLFYNFDASPQFRTDWREMGHEKAMQVVRKIGNAIEIMFEAAKMLLKGE